MPGVGRVAIGVELWELEGRGLDRIPRGVIGDHVFQRRVLLDEQGLPRGVDAVEVFARGLLWIREAGTAKHDQERDGTGGVFRRDDGHVDLDGDCGIGRVVDFADEVFGDDAVESDHLVVDGGDGPLDAGHVFGNAAVDVFLVQVDDLGTALVPPHLRRGDGLAVVKLERVGEIGIDIGLRLIVIGVVGGFFIAARAGAQPLDAELVHHVPMVLVRGEGDRRRRGGNSWCALGERGGGADGRK